MIIGALEGDIIMDQKRLPQDIVQRYLNGIANDIEIAMVESWLLQEFQNSDVTPTPKRIKKTHQRIRRGLIQQISKPKKNLLMPRIAATIGILLMLALGAYNFIYKPSQKPPLLAQIKPGTFNNDAVSGNKAILTLGNGQKVAIGALSVGSINNQDHIHIRKTANGAIIYNNNKREDPSMGLIYNTLTIPRGGGKHELHLADGTLALLDAGSSIHFPVSFTGKVRSVSITGQVYFEVVHNARQPFIVTVNNQVIEDLGTHFNVNAFDDETKTTLLEGSIKVNRDLLKPGQQAVVKADGEVNILDNVNEADVMGWKNNFFRFGENTSLQSVMSQLCRWYDMDVVYVGNGKTYHFGGEMPMSLKLSDVLKVLTYSGVKFSINDKKIIVYQ